MRSGMVLVLLAGLVSPSWAQTESPEKAQARVLLSQGNALFEKGELKEALADFRAAYALFPSPKLLVNAAAAERELGNLAGAATDLRHFLDDATEDDLSLVDKARLDLIALEKKVGRIGLALEWPTHTTMEIDGRVARDPTYVAPGAHEVKVRAPLGATLSRSVEVNAGGIVELPMPEGARLSAAAAAAPSQLPLVEAQPVKKKKKRPSWVVPVAVVGSLLVAGGVAAGVLLGAQSSGSVFAGTLGSISYSSFRP